MVVEVVGGICPGFSLIGIFEVGNMTKTDEQHIAALFARPAFVKP